MSVKQHLLNFPIQEGICQNLTFREAIQLRDALAVRHLDCTIAIDDIDKHILVIRGVNTATYELYLDIEQYGSVGALLNAVKEEKVEKIKTLLDWGVPIDSQGDQENTALIVATENISIPVIKYLLDRGANIYLKDHSNQTALYIAVANNSFEIVQLLAEQIPNGTIMAPDAYLIVLKVFESGNLEMISLILPKIEKSVLQAMMDVMQE